MNADLQRIIQTFGMERHHLAGWFAPHFSDGPVWSRPTLSSLYVLLPGDDSLPLHKLDGVEVWHFYSGAPAEVAVSNGGRLHQTSVLGDDLAAGQRPQHAVPAYAWRSVRSLGEWSLLGCTMVPGYAPGAGVTLSADD